MTWEVDIGPAGAPQTFNRDTFKEQNYADETIGLPAALQKIVEHGRDLFKAIATDSVAIGTGSKSFTIDANRPIFIGSYVRAEDAGNSANYMEGVVTAYNTETGALTFTSSVTGGSGTIADWVFRSLGKKGDTGDTGAAGADGVFSAIASQAEAEAGANNTKGVTPLRVKQYVDVALAALLNGVSASFDTLLELAAGLATKLTAASNLSDVASAATAFGNIKQAASESATGVVELATTAEAAGGTDTARAVTPAGLAAAAIMKTGGTLTGGIELTPAPASDLFYNGFTASLTAGESLVFSDVCYIKSDGKMGKGDADAAATAPAIAMALATISNNAAGVFLLDGYVRNDAWNWTVGGVIYLSTTAGGLTQTAPSGALDVVQKVGYATHADRMLFRPSIEYSVTPAVYPSTVELLLVAGAGAGAGSVSNEAYPGGGGAGGLLEHSALSTSGGPFTVTIGAGGAGGAGNGSVGSNSVFGSCTAVGGGIGPRGGQTGGNGGCGGGGGSSANAGSATQGNSGGATGYGFNGGSGTGSGGQAGGGGGGCGAAGDDAGGGGGTDGAGGVGRSNSITGSAVYYGGGGGGANNSGTPSNGGNGGGGNSAQGGTTAQSGTANTGGGGGGSGYVTGNGGSGGSGVCIIRYPDTYSQPSATTGSPTYTNVGGYHIYKWTSSGSVTF